MQPLPLREEAQPGYDPVSWKPSWNCFCCHDTGIIPERIVKTVMPNYIAGRHKPVECNATNCNIRLGELLYKTNTLDTRFTSDICDRMSFEEQQMWQQWSQQRHEMRKERLKILDSPNLTKNLRGRNRKDCEQLLAESRHLRIINEY